MSDPRRRNMTRSGRASARRRSRVASQALAVVFALLVLAACDNGDGDQPAEVTGGTPAPVDAIPPEVERNAAAWPLPNQDYGNHRAAADSTIDASNVDELEVAWSLPLEFAGDWGAAASNPLVIDGTVYFQDLQSNLYAIDFETGEELWRYERRSSAIGPNGPAVGWGRIYAQSGEDHIFAVDLESGEWLWETQLDASTGSQQPTVYGGYVYTGTGSGSAPDAVPEASGRDSYVGGSGGYAYGIDHESGAILWSAAMVEEGFWGNPDVNSGAALWYPPGIDLETGATFWGTGNPAPFPGTVEWPNASSRPGDNLYANSIVAVDGETGEMLWYNQVKPQDLFDLDFQGGPVLAEIDGDEGPRSIVLGYGKLGKVLAFDRESGETIWETVVGEHQNDDLTELPLDEEIVVYPGVWGGVETPIAYADGVVYVLTANLPTPWTATGFEAESGAESVALGSGYTELESGWAQAYAIDAETGAILWEHDLETVAFGAMTVVNDLVFTARLDGMIVAFDRESGEVVWEYQAPGGIIAWPAVAGDTIVWPVGIGGSPQLIALRLPSGTSE